MSNTTLQSHMPILEFLLEQFEINATLEFGCGLYSTPLLLQKCEWVESREMNDAAWLDRVNEVVNKSEAAERWRPRCKIGPTDAINNLFGGDLKDHYDLVLCDGHGDTRAQQAECMIDRSDLIVVHDSQHFDTDVGLYFAWLDCDHTRIDFKDWRKPADLPAGDVWPWTTVLVNDPDRAKVITDWRDAG